MYKNLPQTLPVAGIQKETKRYIVQRDDRPYYVKQLPFQYEKEAPETLACIVRLDEQTNEIIEIKQDYRPYLHAFYKIGQTYAFTIKADRMASGNYYEVNDDLGFFSRIYHVHTRQPLKPGQLVRCSVRSIEGCALRLDFVEVQPEVEEFNRLRQELEAKAQELGLEDNDLIDLLLGIAPNDYFEVLADGWLLNKCANVQMCECENENNALNNEDENVSNETSSSFAHSPICTSAHSASDERENENNALNNEDENALGETSSSFAHSHICTSAHSSLDAAFAHSHICTSVHLLRVLCLFALEDSPMLRNLTPTDQLRIENRLTIMVNHADVMSQALDTIARGKANQLVEDTFTKLKTSGNLYNAAERLLLLDFVLMLTPTLFDKYVELIFEVITLDTNIRLRTERPYRTDPLYSYLRALHSPQPSTDG